MAQVSIITGASRGIGKAIAKKFASENHYTVLVGRNENLLKEVQSELKTFGKENLYFVGDVADPNFAKKCVELTLEKYGKIDNLINNAGILIVKKFIDSDLSEFQEQINTNLIGVYNFTKAALPSMIEKKSGSIINISSLAGKNTFVGGTMYAATKHALMAFSGCLMLEVREHNIRVAVVCPGSVATDMIFNSSMAPANPEKILDPSDVAEIVSTIIKLPARALMSEVEIRPTNPK